MGSRRSTCRLTAMAPLAVGGGKPAARVIEIRRGFWKGSLELASVGLHIGPRVVSLGIAVRLVRFDDRRERGNGLVVAPQPHHDHALRGAAEPLDLLDRDPDHGAG